MSAVSQCNPVTREEFNSLCKQINELSLRREDEKENKATEAEEKLTHVTRKEFDALSKQFEELSQKIENKPRKEDESVLFKNSSPKEGAQQGAGLVTSSLDTIGIITSIFSVAIAPVSWPFFTGSVFLTLIGSSLLKKWEPKEEDINNYISGRTLPKALCKRDNTSISPEQAIKELNLLKQITEQIIKYLEYQDSKGTLSPSCYESIYLYDSEKKETEEIMNTFGIDRKTAKELKEEFRLCIFDSHEQRKKRIQEFDDGLV